MTTLPPSQPFLIKMGTTADLDTQGRLVKEMPDRCLVIVRQPTGEPVCVELKDAQYMQRDNGDLVTAPGSRTHRVINDGGMLWIAPIPKPSPIVDKLSGPKPGDAAAAAAAGPPAPPLVPFAGCDRKALPPSPAKPFAMQASPIKPSPIHDRVEHATAAVASKAWGARQAKMSEFFGGGGGGGGAPRPGAVAAAAGAPPAKLAAAAAPVAPQPQPAMGAVVQDMDF